MQTEEPKGVAPSREHKQGDGFKFYNEGIACSLRVIVSKPPQHGYCEISY